MRRYATGLMLVLASVTCDRASAQTAQANRPGESPRAVLDDYLVGEMKNVQLLVHPPVREEIAVNCDCAWEGNGCGYYTVLHDKQEGVYRMYYHAWQIPTGIEPGGPLTIAYCESKDGIQWKRPNLGLCEFQGSKDNNIVLDKMGDGTGCHDFSPFIDTNPKRQAGRHVQSHRAASRPTRASGPINRPTGSTGRRWPDAPVFTQGVFDSQNISFWSSERAEVRPVLPGVLRTASRHASGQPRGVGRFPPLDRRRDARFSATAKARIRWPSSTSTRSSPMNGLRTSLIGFPGPLRRPWADRLDLAAAGTGICAKSG